VAVFFNFSRESVAELPCPTARKVAGIFPVPVPNHPKLYHIVHADRLPSILADGFLWSDTEVLRRKCAGTTIGMSSIKRRRLEENVLASHFGLMVGQCVPFYFCPRSIMLYLIHQANHAELTYRGGQGPIVHLQFDLNAVAEWAMSNEKRWAFTLSNAGSRYFEDRATLTRLQDINWDAVAARKWSGLGIDSAIKEGKQAEFLVEERCPWGLAERIGVNSQSTYQRVVEILAENPHRPPLEIQPDWYY
jgi:hypothetical protein